MKHLLSAALLALSPAMAVAQGTPSTGSSSTPHAIVAVAPTIQWQPAPPSLPAGAKVAVLEGDPAQPGPFTMRIWLPDGYRIAPHFHPSQERVTVISGTFLVGAGNTFDVAKGTELPAGAYASMPPGMAHFAWAKGETVLQLNNIGPWSLTYVDPADDPRKRAGR